MEIIKGAKHTVADVAVALDKAGREHLVIAVKATYRIPENNKVPRPVIPPQPLVMSDIFIGEPGLSAPLYECDFVLRKAKCDVLFNAKGYTSDGQPKKRSVAAFQIGDLKKEVVITGVRYWDKGAFSTGISESEYFSSMPLHYGNAFGGSRAYVEKEKELFDTYEANPIGKGYSSRGNWADPKLNYLPTLSVPGKGVKSKSGAYVPIAFSVLPRNSLTRRKYAGTYDEKWRKDVFPFLPADFDERYWQSAPPDQQIAFPQGGETVVLKQLTKDRPEISFRLPRLTNMPIKILGNDYKVHTPKVVVDTLYFEPDAERFSVVWRSSIPLKRHLKEIKTIAIGAICKDWWDAKQMGLSHCGGCEEKNRSTEKLPEDCDQQAIT